MSEYEVVSTNNGVKKLLEDYKIFTVTGGYFGDEAKGKVVHSLMDYVDGVARVNSGENAGHTVTCEGKKFVFHLTPSGVITGKPTFIGDNCVMDPISFMDKEIKQLKDNDVDYSNLIIGNPFVVMPWHKIVDMMRNPNASTGKGISASHQDIRGKRGVRLDDLINGDFDKIKKSAAFWRTYLDEKGILNKSNDFLNFEKIPQHIKYFFETKGDEDIYLEELLKVINSQDFPSRGNVRESMLKILEGDGRVLLEGPQSFFLSNSEPTHYNSTTSPDVHASGILSASGLPITKFPSKSVSVLKVPASRVGSGANPSGYVEQDWFSKKNLTKKDLEKLNLDFEHVYNTFVSLIDESGRLNDETYTNSNLDVVKLGKNSISVGEALAIATSLKYDEFGATTGKPRVCGPLDLLHLKHVVRTQGEDISLSAIDRLDGLEKVLLVDRYMYDGEGYNSNRKQYTRGDEITLDASLPVEAVLKDCIPRYKLFNGWMSTENYEEGQKLSKNLARFLNYIEDQTGARITSVGNGPETKSLLYLSRI